MNAKSILIVDDDPNLRRTLSDVLKIKGYAPVGAAKGKTALNRVKKKEFAVVLIDLKLPDMDGLELVREIKACSPGTESILLTGYASQASAIEAINLGAYSYVQKPYDMEQLLVTIRRAVEKWEAEKALRRSEAAYRSLFEQSADGIVIVAKDRIVQVNQAFCALHDLPAEEILGMHPTDLVHPDDRDVGSQRIEAILSGDPITESYVYRVLRSDGAIHWGEVRGKRIEWGGEPALQVIVRDVTGRRQANEALRESEERFRTFFEDASVGMAMGSFEYRFLRVNRALCDMLGYTEQELLTMGLADVTHPDDWEIDRANAQQLLAGEKTSVRREKRYIHKDGHVLWGSLNLAVVHDANGDPVHLIAQIQDITEHRRADEALRENEKRFRSIAETADDAIIIFDMYENVFYWNRAAQNIFGYHAGETQGKLLASLVPRRFHDAFRQEMESAASREAAGGSGKAIEMMGIRKGGSEFPLELSLATWSTGEDTFFTAIVRDITGRKQAEEALEVRVRQLAALSQASQAVTASLEIDQVLAKIVSLAGEVVATNYTSVVVVDEAGRLGESADNLPGVPTLGYRIRDNGLTRWIVSSHQAAIVHQIAEDGTMSPAPGKGAPRFANPPIVEAGVKSLAGLPLMVKDRLLGVLYLHSLQPGAFQGQLPLLTAFANQAATAIENARLYERTQRELTERKRTQEALRQYAQRLRALRAIDGAILAAWSPEEVAQAALRHIRNLVPCRRASVTVLDTAANTGTLIAAQASGETRVGPGTHLPPEDFGDLDALRQGKHYAVEDISGLPQPTAVEQALLEEGVRSFTLLPLIAHGQLIGTLNLGAESPGKLAPAHVDIAREVGDELAVALHQARLLTALETEWQRLETLVSHLPEGILLLDRERRVLLSNPAAMDYLPLLTGVAEPPMSYLGSALAHLAGRPVEELIQPPTEGLWHELDVTAPRHRVFEVAAQPVNVEPRAGGWVLIIRDATQERAAERQARQQERLAAIGQLAGGIAHDFNNFLTSIMLYAQLLLGKSHLPSDVKTNVEIILDESRGAAQLVQQILDFSRRAMIETGPVDLKPFIEKAADILQQTLPENIRVAVETEPETYMVDADPTRIQQVVMNLAFNARDAMPKGGELRIRLSRTIVRAGEEPPVAEMEPGNWACLAISDTGTGIPPNVMPHMFEPFFTTKGPGKGTGLGLAQVHGIVGQHGGCIGVETTVGQGTTFRVYLPIHESREGEAAPGMRPAVPGGRGETILLAEDEDNVREAGREILKSLGYRLLTAADGREALEIFRSAEDMDLVITDLVMPEIGGIELAQELKKINPRVKVLAITGYALGEDIEELRKAGVLDIIRKPLEVNTLAKTIRRVLDAE